MFDKKRLINTTAIIFLLVVSKFVIITPNYSKALQVISAEALTEVDWNLEDIQKPIIPRDEIKELELLIKFRIETDNYIGMGLLLGYAGSDIALIDLEIVETSPWCSAVLQQTLVATNISEYEETTTKLYLSLEEDAPAYGDGFIKIKARTRALNIIKGSEKIFNLSFSPAYLPIIKTNLPEVNTKRIYPLEKAVFPIELENAGNARTRVTFEIENVPEGWEASIKDFIVLKEAKGSKEIAYLSVIPPNGFGYHYDEANIMVTMTPSRAEDEKDTGNPLYATFAVQNRGFSTNGIEQILFIGIFVLLIFVAIVLLLRRIREK